MADARRVVHKGRVPGLAVALALALGIGGCGTPSGDGVFGGSFEVQQIEIGVGGTLGILGQVLPLTPDGQGSFLPPSFFPDPASFAPAPLPGNYFIRIIFNQPIAASSIYSPDVAFNGTSGLVGSISITDQNGAHVPGIPVINGRDRFGKIVTGNPGYPTIAGNTNKTVFLYVAEDPAAQDDRINNGSPSNPFQGFPIGQIRIQVTNALVNKKGEALSGEACTATLVDDAATAGSSDDWNPTLLDYSPKFGALAVNSPIELRFSEPVRTAAIGPPMGSPSNSAAGVTFMSFGVFRVPVNAQIKSTFDPCTVIVTPGVPWPGNDRVDVTVRAGGGGAACGESFVCDLSGLGFASSGPLCGTGGDCTFSLPTAPGPAFVNAPVTPEAVYFTTGGSSPGVGVIDMNGWGCDVFLPTPQVGIGNDSPIQTTNVHPSDGYCVSSASTTGVPVVFLTDFGTGMGTKAPAIPDVVRGGGRLVRDSKGDHRLTKPPTILGPITDIQVGGFLDRVFTNPDENQSASSSFNALSLVGNCTGWSPLIGIGWSPPVPNPPCYRVPPLRMNPFIPSDFLVPMGCPFTHPKDASLFIGGNGPCCQTDLLTQPQGICCAGVWINRQQIGNFLYVVDKGSSSVVVLNSNTFQVLATIFTPDPEGLGMSPDLRRLYVSNFDTSTVSVIDTDPNSLNFHTVIKTIQLLDGQGNPSGQVGPTGVAVNPDNEDVLVCGTLGNNINIIDVNSLAVRKVVTNGLNHPTELALTQRQGFVPGFGYQTGTYFGFIVNSGAKNLVVYESGPFAPTGSIGFDDIIGPVSIPGGVSSFGRIQVDGTSMGPIAAPDDRGGGAAAFVTYTDPSGAGKVARLGLTESPFGIQQIQFVQGQQPGFRNKVFEVVQSFSGFSGQPSDIAFDDVSNYGCQVANHKLLVTNNLFSNPPQAIVPVNMPGDPFGIFGVGTWGAPRGGGMFVVNADAGVIDIIDPQGGVKKGSLPVPGVRLAANYFDQ